MKDCDLWNPIGTVRDTVRGISQDIKLLKYYLGLLDPVKDIKLLRMIHYFADR